MIRHARQIASVCSASRNAGPASKPSSRIICSEYMPQPSTNSGASVSSRVSDGCRDATTELEVVARVRLVDAGVADRGAVVLAHGVRVVVHGRRHDVDPDRVGIERRRREVRRERHDVAQVLGRRDDVDPLVVRDRDQVVIDQVLAGPSHRQPVRVERRLERRRVV